MGIFKFKSTKRGSKPTREDIAKQIRNGIPGTQMVKIAELTESDVQALTDYVIYLSIRGELERSLIDDAVFELDIEGGDRILDTEFASRMNETTIKEMEAKIEAWEDNGEKEEDEPTWLEDFELYQESWEIVEDMVVELVEEWLDAEDDVVDVPGTAGRHSGCRIACRFCSTQQWRSGRRVGGVGQTRARGVRRKDCGLQ